MIEQLKSYVKANNMHKKALEYFWVAFNNWKKNNPENYQSKFANIEPNALNVFVHAIGLRSSQWPDCDFNHLTISILIYYEEHSLGEYVYWFSLSADVDDDDFLEIY